jgi:mRNA-degrading endonuclease toxin of MazEF toxin-antitoxin module
MQKDFDTWNKLKKQIQERPIDFHIKQRQIWWCSLGINIGSEQDGKNENFERPVLIYKFINKDMVLILPFTSSIKIDRHHVVIHDESLNKSSIILSQVRVMSPKRLLRQVGWVPEDQFFLVVQKLQEYFLPRNVEDLTVR